MKSEEESSEDLIEIKQKLENSMGTEEFQQRINQARSKVSGSISESGSIADRRSLNGSLRRYYHVEFFYLSFYILKFLKIRLDLTSLPIYLFSN